MGKMDEDTWVSLGAIPKPTYRGYCNSIFITGGGAHLALFLTFSGPRNMRYLQRSIAPPVGSWHAGLAGPERKPKNLLLMEDV